MAIPLFDAHCDTISEALDSNQGLRKNNLHLDLERGGEFAPCAQVFAVFAAGDGVQQRCEALLSRLLAELEKNSDAVQLCLSAEDVKKAADNKIIGALISIEGAELIDCSESMLESACKRGVRAINLCWNFDNALCGAALGNQGYGLTEKGKSFLKTAQDLGVAVDLSHASERTFWDVLENSRKPVYASHSNSLLLCGHPRNLTDEQASAIAMQNGVIGVNYVSDFLKSDRRAAIDDVVRHIEHFLTVGGEKSVCLGSDFDGTDELPRGISGIESMGELYEALLRRGHSERLARDIFYHNLMDYFSRAIL